MPRCDRRLVRPSVHDLLAALREAGGDCADWEPLLADIRSRPEGLRRWDADTRGVAWWTDAGARRHFRVWDDGPSKEERPPLWYISGEHLVARWRGEACDWLVLCACGACGEPEEVGW